MKNLEQMALPELENELSKSDKRIEKLTSEAWNSDKQEEFRLKLAKEYSKKLDIQAQISQRYVHAN